MVNGCEAVAAKAARGSAGRLRRRGMPIDRFGWQVAASGGGWQASDRDTRETGNRMISWGHMTEALIPVSGFPMRELN
jgi:hypothetical protein